MDNIKEKTIKVKSANKKNRKRFFSIAAICFLLLFILVDYVFIIKKSKVLAPAPTSNTATTSGSPSVQEVTTDQNNNIDKYKSDTEKQTEANNPSDPSITYYNQGLANFDKKNYQDAENEFTQAIRLNAQNEEYYNKKSQAEMNLGETQTAIDTIKAGLSVLPNSDLLKSKLDILQNNQLGNQEGVK